MDKQRWGEICLEEGYSQFAIDRLWEEKPDDIKLEEKSEYNIRFSCRLMKEAQPDWATREDDEEWKQ